MLHWKPLPPELREEYAQFKSFTRVLLASDGFLQQTPTQGTEVQDLPEEVRSLVRENLPLYQQLREQRLRPAA